jgi:dTDP-4-dehydrorhamnose 3,5-epimerase-like enzyme
VLWNDPALGIAWPFAAEEAIVSAKDQQGKFLKDAEVFL